MIPLIFLSTLIDEDRGIMKIISSLVFRSAFFTFKIFLLSEFYIALFRRFLNIFEDGLSLRECLIYLCDGAWLIMGL